MGIKKHPLIIMFDFDGVLIDSRGAELAAFECMRNPYFGWNKEELRNCRPIDLIRRFEMSDSKNSREGFNKMWRNFSDLLPSGKKRSIFYLKMGINFRRYEYLKSDFLPGVVEKLRILGDSGIIMGICSNSERERIALWLKRKNLEKIITDYTSRNDKRLYGIKPSPAPLLALLIKIKQRHKLRKIDKSRVFFCGDCPTDVWAAQNAGIKSIAVLSGHGRSEELRYLGADYLIKSVAEIDMIPEIKNELVNRPGSEKDV